MGFIREYGIIIGAALILSLIGTVWIEKGHMDSATEIASTIKTVEPIRDKENEIQANPLRAASLIKCLRNGTY